MIFGPRFDLVPAAIGLGVRLLVGLRQPLSDINLNLPGINLTL